MTINLKIVLHLLHHGTHHLAERGVQEHIGKIHYILRYTSSHQESSTLIGKVVTVMLENVICILSEAWAYFF